MSPRRLPAVLAAGTVLTFTVATGAAAGVVPHHHAAKPAVAITHHYRLIQSTAHQARPAAHSGTTTTHVAVDHVTRNRHHATAQPPNATPATTPAPPTTSTATSPTTPTRHSDVPAATTAVRTHHRHHHLKPKPTHTATHKATHKSTHKTTDKPKPSKPAKATRTTPTTSQVQAALQGLKKFVHSILSPTSSEVAEFGDLVCGAFDDGKSDSTIKSEILTKVKSIPLTTILPGAADYVVNTAVKLFCPGYTSKLG